MNAAGGGAVEGLEAARAANAQGRPALLWRRLIADTETPVAAALKLIEPGRGDFLLESVEGGAVRGRHSLIGLAPDLVFRAEGQAQVDSFVQRNTEARLGAAPGHLLPAGRGTGMHMTDNPGGENDGFFYATLVRQTS